MRSYGEARIITCVQGHQRGREMTKELPLGRYRHYKGREYWLIGTARHSETLELLAVYHSLDDPVELWVRPLSMWQELVEVDGLLVPRFIFCGAEDEDKLP